MDKPVNLLSTDPVERRKQLQELYDAGLIDRPVFNELLKKAPSK